MNLRGVYTIQMKTFFQQLLAAILFFTRLPIGRWVNIPTEVFKKIIYLWPFTGWLTGGVIAFSWLFFSCFFPATVALILTLFIRVLFTGGLHEDGLGDFIDGFGGGHTKESILRIMKDSNVGSYALMGMVFYFLLLFFTLISIPKGMIWSLLLVADPLAKMVAATLTTTLEYARPESESKFKVSFTRLNAGQWVAICFFGLAPMMLFFAPIYWIALVAPILSMLLIRSYVKRKIGGYTGDICGATFLIAELSFFLAILAFLN